MTTSRTRDDFLRFLDYLGAKGLIPVATASSRRATAGKVTAVFSESEARDVITVDLDDVMRRFDHLNPHQYGPGSLQTYKSRMKTALDDFRLYCENPLNFRPSGQRRAKIKVGMEAPKRATMVTTNEPASPVVSSSQALPNIDVLPVPLRVGLTVQIAGLPFDLTAGEARKIANIVLAHANAD